MMWLTAWQHSILPKCFFKSIKIPFLIKNTFQNCIFHNKKLKALNASNGSICEKSLILMTQNHNPGWPVDTIGAGGGSVINIKSHWTAFVAWFYPPFLVPP